MIPTFFLTHNNSRGREKGRCDSPLSLPRTPTLFMTYPDEQSESLEGQMQSYTVSGRRSLFETDV